MTDEVASLVLRNNYLQTLALSLAERRGMEDFGFLQRLIQTLETRGLLDRAVEFLPDDMTLTERRRRIAAVHAARSFRCCSLTPSSSLYDDLLESAVPDDPYLARELGPLFPEGDRRALPRRARTSSAAPRDHRHAARQFDDQSRRPDADRAHRRSDRRRARGDRLRVRRGARQLRHDGAQRRDRRARQSDCWQSCNSSFTPPSRICCSTASSGSCAMSICRKGLAGIVSHYRDGIAAVDGLPRRRAVRRRPGARERRTARA